MNARFVHHIGSISCFKVQILLQADSFVNRVEPYACQEIVEGEDDHILEFMLGYNRVSQRVC